jgi:DUF2934 family protein
MPVDFAEKMVTRSRDLDEDAAEPLLDPMAEPTYDEIATAAYARWVARGGADGSDVADWLEAEEALRQRGN